MTVGIFNRFHPEEPQDTQPNQERSQINSRVICCPCVQCIVLDTQFMIVAVICSCIEQYPIYPLIHVSNNYLIAAVLCQCTVGILLALIQRYTETKSSLHTGKRSCIRKEWGLNHFVHRGDNPSRRWGNPQNLVFLPLLPGPKILTGIHQPPTGECQQTTKKTRLITLHQSGFMNIPRISDLCTLTWSDSCFQWDTTFSSDR